MRIIIFVLVSLLLSNIAFAKQAIRLNPYKGDKELKVDITRSFSGSCGAARVRVTGVTEITGHFYSIDTDAAKITIRINQPRWKELVLDSSSGALSDHNGVACIGNNRLVIWHQCGGSACQDGYNFTIVDTENLLILAPKELRKENCDEKCASEVLGNFPIHTLFL